MWRRMKVKAEPTADVSGMSSARCTPIEFHVELITDSPVSAHLDRKCSRVVRVGADLDLRTYCSWWITTRTSEQQE
jgi:hypothetical protein